MTKSFDVFLSHMSADKPAVRKIAEALVAAGLNVWFDESNIVPGVSWQSSLEQAITESKSALIILGETGFGPWQEAEMAAALRYTVKERRPIIPVYLPGAKQADLPLFLASITGVQIKSWNDHDFRDALKQIIGGITGTLPTVPKATPIPKVFLCHAKEDDPKIKKLVLPPT